MQNVEKVLQDQVLRVAQTVEQQLDAEIQKLDELDSDGIEKLRRDRLEQLKKQAEQKKLWLSIVLRMKTPNIFVDELLPPVVKINESSTLFAPIRVSNGVTAGTEKNLVGHGEYEELTEEKEFFAVTKKSSDVVVHFFKHSTPRCKIVDFHFDILCKKHLETRFCKIDVERAPFLTERLQIKVIPTIFVLKDTNFKDRIVGFTDLGNCDDFSTEILEWRLAQTGVINYSGDLLHPPDKKKRFEKQTFVHKKHTIRGKEDDDSSDDDFE